eukprot:178030-Chlamydomonas_euryale.AAC.8
MAKAAESGCACVCQHTQAKGLLRCWPPLSRAPHAPPPANTEISAHHACSQVNRLHTLCATAEFSAFGVHHRLKHVRGGACSNCGSGQAMQSMLVGAGHLQLRHLAALCASARCCNITFSLFPLHSSRSLRCGVSGLS